MTKKILTVILAIAVITSLSLSTALMAVEMNDYLVIGEGDVIGDPNLNFNSLPETEGIYGVKLDSTDENWKAGVKFGLPSEPVMMNSSNKTKHLVDSSFDLLYVLIKAGSIQSGAGDWVFILNPEGDFELLNCPAGSEDHYTITFEDGIITVSQTDRSGVKDVSHISFFFQEGTDDDIEGDADADDDDDGDADADVDDDDDDDGDADADDDDDGDENIIIPTPQVLADLEEGADIPDPEVLDDFDDEQPDTGTIFVRLLLVGLILLIISVAILYFQRSRILKDY